MVWRRWSWYLLSALAFAVPSQQDSPVATADGIAAGADSWSLRAGSFEALLRRQGQGLSWRHIAWSAIDGGPCDELLLGPLFVMRTSGGHAVSSEDCQLDGAPVLEQAQRISAKLSCPQGLLVEWSAQVEELRASLGAFLRVKMVLSGRRLSELTGFLVRRSGNAECGTAAPTGSVDGSPVATGQGRFIVAMEHPLAKIRVVDKRQPASPFSWVSTLTHLEDVWQSDAEQLSYGGVVVAVAEPGSQARRAFAAYLHAARPEGAWAGPLVHYNSWYDFTSWQDEGFFQNHSEVLAKLREEPMCEAGALKRVEAFKELVDRGVVMDSFLLDDGWDDPTALWEFNRTRFPQGFERVAAKAKELGAGLSVWLSPWGGYGSAKDERVRLARAQGFETNEHGLSLAGPKYAARFKAAVHRFRLEAGVNMFKFDGVAGDPEELAAEVEAVLRIAADLRRESRAQASNESGADQGGAEKTDSFWINLTTGTWPSPFFLLWVDSIWRGNTDTNVPSFPSLEGLTRRQRWQVWRECVVHEMVVKRARLFPIPRLMVHGAVLAAHGDALANGLSSLGTKDWAQEVWSLAAMGLQLQELYVSAKFMTPWAWDELASALKWARENSEILEDAHWAIPASCEVAAKKKSFKPYALAAYRMLRPDGTGEGFLMLRNPRNKTQRTPSFTLAVALELPLAATSTVASAAPARAVMEVVRRMSFYPASGKGLNCTGLGKHAASEEVEAGRCAVACSAPLRPSLSPGELLVLRVEIARPPAAEGLAAAEAAAAAAAARSEL